MRFSNSDWRKSKRGLATWQCTPSCLYQFCVRAALTLQIATPYVEEIHDILRHSQCSQTRQQGDTSRQSFQSRPCIWSLLSSFIQTPCLVTKVPKCDHSIWGSQDQARKSFVRPYEPLKIFFLECKPHFASQKPRFHGSCCEGLNPL